MSEQTSLEDLLAPQSRDKPNADAHKIDATPRQAVADTPAEPEAADAKEPATSKGEKTPADAAKSAEGDDVPPASSQDKDQRNVPVKALEDERRKRQEAEKARKELEARIAELERLAAPQPQQATPQQDQQKQQQPQNPQAAPDPWSDPEGYAAYQRELQEQMLFETRVTLGQDMMRLNNPDYDEVEAVFAEEAQQNPYLIEQLRRAHNPAKYAYEQGKRLKLMREIGTDPDAYRKRIEEELRAKLAAEMPQTSPSAAAAPAPAPKKAPPPPTSLAGVPSAAPRDASKVKWDGPTPLDDILR